MELENLENHSKLNNSHLDWHRRRKVKKRLIDSTTTTTTSFPISSETLNSFPITSTESQKFTEKVENVSLTPEQWLDRFYNGKKQLRAKQFSKNKKKLQNGPIVKNMDQMNLTKSTSDETFGGNRAADSDLHHILLKPLIVFSGEDGLSGQHFEEDETKQKKSSRPMDKMKIKFGTKLSNINVNQSQSKMKIKDKNNINEAVRSSEKSNEKLNLVSNEIEMVLIPKETTKTGIPEIEISNEKILLPFSDNPHMDVQLDPTLLEEHLDTTEDEDSDRWGDSIVFSEPDNDNSLKKMPRLLLENNEANSLEGLKIIDNSVVPAETMIIFPQENVNLTSEPVPVKTVEIPFHPSKADYTNWKPIFGSEETIRSFGEEFKSSRKEPKNLASFEKFKAPKNSQLSMTPAGVKPPKSLKLPPPQPKPFGAALLNNVNKLLKNILTR